MDISTDLPWDAVPAPSAQRMQQRNVSFCKGAPSHSVQAMPNANWYLLHGAYSEAHQATQHLQPQGQKLPELAAAISSTINIIFV